MTQAGPSTSGPQLNDETRNLREGPAGSSFPDDYRLTNGKIAQELETRIEETQDVDDLIGGPDPGLTRSGREGTSKQETGTPSWSPDKREETRRQSELPDPLNNLSSWTGKQEIGTQVWGVDSRSDGSSLPLPGQICHSLPSQGNRQQSGASPWGPATENRVDELKFREGETRASLPGTADRTVPPEFNCVEQASISDR